MTDFETDSDFLKRNIHSLREVRRTPMLPSSWAKENRILRPETTSLPGMWSDEQIPYITEILDTGHPDNPAQHIAICKGAQTGFTVSVLENLQLYHIAENPSSVLYVFPTTDSLRMRMKINFETAIDSSNLRKFIKSGSIDKKGRKSGDTIELKEFPGGFILGASFESRGKFRSFSVKRLFFDELDSAPSRSTKGEGDPISNFVARTQAYGSKKKIYYLSTPTTIIDSRIWELYLSGDQRRYFVPCPHCQFFHFFDQNNFRYRVDKDDIIEPESIYFECPNCKKEIREHHKKVMLSEGEWRPTSKAKSRNYLSYHISSFYAPTAFDNWEDIAGKHHKAQIEVRETGDYGLLENYTKLQLGIPWEPQEEKIVNAQLLYSEKQQVSTYKSGTENLPDEILFLTAGCDVGKSYIVVEIIGWAQGAISFSVDYRKIEHPDFQVRFDSLIDLLSMPRTTESGRELIMSMALIDAGYSTDEIYASCSEAYGIYPCMGFSGAKKSRQLITKTNIKSSGNIRYDLNVDSLKDRFYRNLAKSQSQNPPLAGTCFFPADYEEKFYKELISEKKVRKRNRAGRFVESWIQVRRENHGLDCRLYGLAAFYSVLSTTCLEVLKLKSIEFKPFWEYAKSKAGIIEIQDENKKDEK